MGSKGSINTLILDLEGACPGASAPFPHLQPKPLLALLRAALAHPMTAAQWPVPRWTTCWWSGVPCLKATGRNSIGEGAGVWIAGLQAFMTMQGGNF